MASAFPISLRNLRLSGFAAKAGLAALCAVLAALAIAGLSRLIAQVEGDRGIAPIASSQDIEINGIEVNVSGESAVEARRAGWRLAQRKAWAKINGPEMSDERLDNLVSAIVIDGEQIGPRRYIATLGVIFDRTKASQFVRASGGTSGRRSAPLLVIPVLYSGGVRQVFEVRGAWQKAWANFQTAASSVDYVRPTGSGGESLILTAGQPGRRSRLWWRTVLDQFEAADVIVPVARLERQWPGGPIHGIFTARYGPDNKFLETFQLKAKNESAVPAMLNQALVRMDKIYGRALDRGLLTPDPTLKSGEAQFESALAQLAARLRAAQEPEQSENAAAEQGQNRTAATAAPTISTFSVQFDSPDAGMVDSALAGVRGVAGVRSAATTSIAIGGTSVMRVTMAGSLDGLATALRGQGWQVTVGRNALRIRR